MPFDQMSHGQMSGDQISPSQMSLGYMSHGQINPRPQFVPSDLKITQLMLT